MQLHAAAAAAEEPSRREAQLGGVQGVVGLQQENKQLKVGRQAWDRKCCILGTSSSMEVASLGLVYVSVRVFKHVHTHTHTISSNKFQAGYLSMYTHISSNTFQAGYLSMHTHTHI